MAKKISIRLDDKLALMLDKHCEDNLYIKSKVVRDLIQKYLLGDKKEKNHA